MKILAADIETDGLLMAATRFHCGVTIDTTTGEKHEFTDIDEMYTHLCTADRIVMHNGRMFDVPVLERLASGHVRTDPLPPCLDTLLISRLLWPDKGSPPPSGGQSLGKWGNLLGTVKQHEDIEDWSVYTPEMLERCGSDVEIQVSLYNYLLPRLKGWGESVQLEHTVATIIAKQIQNGFPIDMGRVEALENDLMYHRAGALDQIGAIPDKVDVVNLKLPHYWYNPDTLEAYRTKGAAPSRERVRLERGPCKFRVDVVEFNPASDAQVRDLFHSKYGWVGEEKTDSGLCSVKGDVLDTLSYPEAKPLAILSKVDKVLTYPANYKKFAIGDKVHGDLITNGCVTGRMSHSKPNMGNNPAGNEGEDDDGNDVVLWGEEGGWGIDCRHCFVAREGWTLVGMDAKALEARMLGHYVSEWDDGEFGRMLLETDVHSLNQKLAGLSTRAEAKTFYFKFVYGGRTDKAVESKLYAKCPALKILKAKYIKMAKNHHKIRALDGRIIPIRKRPLYGKERTQEEKDARQWGVSVNTLLQSAGAIVMKKSLCIFYENATLVYGPHGGRWGLCANVHDEFQWECEKDIAEGMGQMACDAIELAGLYFKMGVRLDGEYKVGNSWAETH